MNKPQITEADLHAWLDDELPQSRRAEIDAYIAAYPLEGERLAAYRRNDAALEAAFDPVLAEPVPAHLLRRRSAAPGRVWRHAAALGWVLIGGLVGWQLHDVKSADRRAEPPSWAHRAAVAHVVYSPEVRHPVEVGASDQEHLVAWLSKRLGTAVKIPRLDSVGYGLVGGRLLPGEQEPAAQFMYQDGNVRQFYWIDRGMGYALSGEIGKDDLLRVANAVYQQLNP